MSVMQCACPKCAMQLQIAQVLPVNVKCPGCQTVFTVGGPAPPRRPQAVARRSGAPPRVPPLPNRKTLSMSAAMTTSGPSAAGRDRGTALPWILACGAILVVGGVVVAVLVLRQDRRAERQNRSGPLDARQAKINEAVVRGVNYLRKQILEGKNRDYYVIDKGADIGVLALAGLTLLECDLPPSDEAVRRVEQDVRGAAPAPQIHLLARPVNSVP